MIFLSHSVHVHLLQWHHAQHSQVGQIAHYDIACDNSRGTVFQTLEFLPLKDTLKAQYFMTHYNRLHPSALLCHRPAEERRKGDAGFLGTVTVKGKYPLLGKEILKFTRRLYFSITREELLQTSFVIHVQANTSYHTSASPFTIKVTFSTRPLLALEILILGVPICQQQQTVFEQVTTFLHVCDN